MKCWTLSKEIGYERKTGSPLGAARPHILCSGAGRQQVVFTLNGNTRCILHEAILNMVGCQGERRSLVPVLLFGPQFSQERVVRAENKDRVFLRYFYLWSATWVFSSSWNIFEWYYAYIGDLNIRNCIRNRVNVIVHLAPQPLMGCHRTHKQPWNTKCLHSRDYFVLVCFADASLVICGAWMFSKCIFLSAYWLQSLSLKTIYRRLDPAQYMSVLLEIVCKEHLRV